MLEALAKAVCVAPVAVSLLFSRLQLQTAPKPTPGQSSNNLSKRTSSISRFDVAICPAKLSISPENAAKLQHAFVAGPAFAAQRLEALEAACASPAGKARRLNKVFIDTPLQRQLLRELGYHLWLLSAGRFKGFDGIACRLLEASRGAGKTFVLQMMTQVAEASFPNVIPMYISFDHIFSPDSAFSEMSLIDVVIEQLRKRGIEVDLERNPKRHLAVLQALADLDLRLLLYVDEIDKAYLVSPSQPKLWQNALDSLGTLHWLGSQTSGRFGVMLCGSSPAAGCLVRRNDMRWAKDYPLLAATPKLDRTRYPGLRLPLTLCTDVEGAQHIVSAFKGSQQQSSSAAPPISSRVPLEFARLLTFMTGAVPGDLLLALRSFSAASAAGNRFTPSCFSRGRTLSAESGVLLDAMLAQMRIDNRDLVDRLSTNGAPYAAKAASVPWEKEFVPCSWAKLSGIYVQLQATDTIPPTSEGSVDSDLLHRVLYLCDRGYLGYDSFQGGFPAHVYPYAMIQVAVEPSAWNKIADTWAIFSIQFLHDQSQNMIKALTDSML